MSCGQLRSYDLVCLPARSYDKNFVASHLISSTISQLYFHILRSLPRQKWIFMCLFLLLLFFICLILTLQIELG